MYDLKHFQTVLYLVLALGVSGFALAAEQPGLWLLSMLGLGLNVWLVATKRFRPLPRWVSSVIAVVMAVFVVIETLHGLGTPILLIGEFFVLLQLVKLFEVRGNRDYMQLLVTSWLLMVAAMISTASLMFATVMLAHLLMALYCSLLLHLKVEADAARAAQALPEGPAAAATLRQDQRHLPRSMRKLTGLVSSFSLVSAVLVFLFFPRGPGSGLFGQFVLRTPETLTGFTDTVAFQDVAKITQNDQRVAYVMLSRRVGRELQPVAGTQTLSLRGTTLNRYDASFKWHGGHKINPVVVQTLSDGETWSNHDEVVAPWPSHGAGGAAPPASGDEWHQHVQLDPTGTRVLFALPGITSFTPRRELKIQYSRFDESLQTIDVPQQAIEYDVVSRNALGVEESGGQTPADQIDPRIREYALRPDVGGEAARQRPVDGAGRPVRVADVDEQVARNIELHLQTTFNYTLDLTDAGKLAPGEDPMVRFLYDLKRGHCEYFAGAMTLMCQSLGMQARLVVGFKCDEYNTAIGAYVVRQSHAHAWVEVLTRDHGWQSFDPTSGRADEARARATFWRSVKHFFDYLEYQWASGVVGYDADRRDGMIQSLDVKLVNMANRNSSTMYRWQRKLRRLAEWLNDPSQGGGIIAQVAAGVIAVLALAGVGAIAWFTMERYRIRRRAARIGLDALPTSKKLRLARQLGFYEELIEVLNRHGIQRPAHLTHREFCRSLTFLPIEAYERLDRLTDVYYRVRFGATALPHGQQRRLRTVVSRLAATLNQPTAPVREST